LLWRLIAGCGVASLGLNDLTSIVFWRIALTGLVARAVEDTENQTAKLRRDYCQPLHLPNSIRTLLERMIGWRQWLRIDSLIVMETASQTERDGKEKGGNNATVVHGKFPLSSRDNFIATG